MADDVKRIVIVSDGTGRTAQRLMDAVLAQYSGKDIDFSVERIYQQVRDRTTLDRIMTEVDTDYLVIYSIIERELSRCFHDRLQESGILHLDVLDPMLTTMSKFLGVHPDYKPGILHIIDDRYYRKVDAIGFAVEHDDGCGHMLREAEIVLLGPSRTCKTPVSMYLACNYGVRAANIPIVADPQLEEHLLRQVSEAERGRVVGLLMQPEVLAQVREERAQTLAVDSAARKVLSRYHDQGEVRQEVRYCRELFERRGWPVVDVTRRAIEEVSAEVLELAGLDQEQVRS